MCRWEGPEGGALDLPSSDISLPSIAHALPTPPPSAQVLTERLAAAHGEREEQRRIQRELEEQLAAGAAPHRWVGGRRAGWTGQQAGW